MSLARLIQQFKEGLTPSAGDDSDRHERLHLATAAVLLEIAHADGSMTPAEDSDLVTHLQRAFQLDAEQVRELMEEAAEIRNRSIDHFAVTNFIRKNATLAERIDIVRTMWRIVYSDDKLTDYEGYLVRKLADLLGLEHHVMIAAKVDVLKERNA